MKQETLEKAAEEYSSISVYSRQDLYNGFIEGACWQEKRMYSEEDMKEAFKAGQDYENFDCRYAFNEWFKQFKKN